MRAPSRGGRARAATRPRRGRLRSPRVISARRRGAARRRGKPADTRTGPGSAPPAGIERGRLPWTPSRSSLSPAAKGLRIRRWQAERRPRSHVGNHRTRLIGCIGWKTNMAHPCPPCRPRPGWYRPDPMRPAALLLLVAAGCTRPAAPAWHVRNGFIRDEQGRAVILRGANLSDAHKRPPSASTSISSRTSSVSGRRGDSTPSGSSPSGPRSSRKRADTTTPISTHWHSVPSGRERRGSRWSSTCTRTCMAKASASTELPDGRVMLHATPAYRPTSPWFENVFDPQRRGVRGRLLCIGRHAVALHRGLAARRAAPGGIPSVIGFDILNEPAWGTHDPSAYDTIRCSRCTSASSRRSGPSRRSGSPSSSRGRA